LSVASPTWTWPEAVHPRLPGGCMGDGHHGWAAAELLNFVRDLLVREVEGPAGVEAIALSSLVPERWYGQGWDVRDAPTALGRVSYSVRWHGDRVALLWEVEPHPGVGPVRLVAPGLDPTWSTTERQGEALLGPVPVSPPREETSVGPAVPPSPDGGTFAWAPTARAPRVLVPCGRCASSCSPPGARPRSSTGPSATGRCRCWPSSGCWSTSRRSTTWRPSPAAPGCGRKRCSTC